VVVDFKECLIRVQSATVKKLLKSDGIYQS